MNNIFIETAQEYYVEASKSLSERPSITKLNNLLNKLIKLAPDAMRTLNVNPLANYSTHIKPHYFLSDQVLELINIYESINNANEKEEK